jgi:hypothetical protein
MHTTISNKVLKWKNCGTYHATECGQYYAYREGHLWRAGRVMFARDIDFRVEFQTLASVKQFLQQHESDKVIFLADTQEGN